MSIHPSPYPAGLAPKGGARNHGECSLQTFADVGGLAHTHDDAGGFRDYLNRFNPGNFWFQDGHVQYWEYTEPYDHWQDTYGADAVKVFYHSGHGGMDANGTFFAPLGATWGDQTWVNSTQMTLANQTLRYAFWSTCLSLRVHDGQSPWRTWSGHVNGMRMLFGWETVSWDYPSYGAKFWEHWRTDHKFSGAWLMAGWDGGHDQAPSAVAMGASAAEAQDRVFNEGMLYDAPVASNWMWWVWWDAVKAAAPGGVTAPGGTIEAPSADAYILELGPLGGRRKQLDGVGRTTIVGDALAHIRLAEPRAVAEAGRAPVGQEALLTAADGVRAAVAMDGIELAPAYTRALRTAGASASERVEDAAAGYAVEYRQVVDGIPVITPDAGYLRVLLDPSGTPTTATLTARPVTGRERRRLRETPQPDSGLGAPLTADAVGGLLAAELAAKAPGAVSAETLAETRQVGYAVDGTHAHLAASQGSLVDFGHGLLKKVRVTVPLNG